MRIYSEGQSMVPSLMPSMTSWGSIPSTVQPTDWAVPSTSFIVPENSLAMERGAMTRAAAMMSSMEMLPLCWMFFTFFRSLGGSFSALMTRAAAEGTTEQVACLFWIFSWTVTLSPFQSAVALAMSSPIFFGDRPSGPTWLKTSSKPSKMRYLKAAKLPHIKLKKLAHLTYSHAENGMRKWLKFGNHWIVFFKTYPPIHYHFSSAFIQLISLSLPDLMLLKTELHCGFRCQKFCNGKNETFWVKWGLNEDPLWGPILAPSFKSS